MTENDINSTNSDVDISKMSTSETFSNEQKDSKKTFKCDKCDFESQTQRGLSTHNSKIHLAYVPIKTVNPNNKTETSDKYIPSMSLEQFKVAKKDISIRIMQTLLISLPCFVSTLVNTKLIKALTKEQQDKLNIFINKKAEILGKEIENSYDQWIGDFYQLLVDLKILNFMIDIKYLSLAILGFSIGKESYSMVKDGINDVKKA